ncbi:MAG: SpoIIE family protein phosphatase [Calditrichia bacterium]
MKVLLIEDEKNTGVFLKSCLIKWGYETEWRRDGLSGFKSFCQDSFSIVIVDWLMPEMNGLDLVKKIREVPRSGYVYIIMLSSVEKKSEMVEAIESGVDDFLRKPCYPAELRARIRAGERIIRNEEILFATNSEVHKDNQHLTRVNDRMRQMLVAASQIQQSLLPKKLLPFEGLSLAWKLRPSRELSGDMLNMIELNDENVGIYLIDVSGQGLAAALLSVSLTRMLTPSLGGYTLFKPSSDDAHNLRTPNEVIDLLNRQFQNDFENPQFFSLFYGVYNRKSRILRFTVAGYPACVKVNVDGEAAFVKEGGLPVGLLPEAQYVTQELKLQYGERIYIYSDSVTRAYADKNSAIYPSRLIDCIEEVHSRSMSDVLEKVFGVAESNAASVVSRDDMSMVGVELN